MEGPDQRPIGWQWHFLDQDNQHGKMQKIAGNDLVATYARTDGCQWTRTTLGFAPASRWSNCPSSGESKVTLSDGVIWPLKVGGTFTYHIEGISSIGKNGWKSKRKCRVQGQWLIEITSGEYETFKVICKEKWSTRTWWLSPEIGTAVAYEQIDLRGRLLIQEMTRIDQESLKEKISEAN
ncbi:MAG: hypothetical protein KTR18_05665 [Acidiferrobacterales bacterium]|nr:hypothetical protein [Acidiferrobacterales bacterium]